MNTPIVFNHRYERQLSLHQVGTKGQMKLAEARVLVVGAGGLGSPILYYLTAAGVGTLGVVDRDIVEATNLQRQILHWEKDLGRAKVISAREKLEAFNSEVRFETYDVEFNLQLARKLIPLYDVTIAAVDNIETRNIINRVCFEKVKPWIEGGVSGFNGLVTMFKPPEGPCYNCLYPNIIDNGKKTIGLLGVLPGVIGVLQAQEAIKLILEIGEPLIGKLLLYNALENRFEIVGFAPTHGCSVCGKN